MPHFTTWDDIYYDYHGGCDLVLISNTSIAVGELHTDVARRAANYQHAAAEVKLNP